MKFEFVPDSSSRNPLTEEEAPIAKLLEKIPALIGDFVNIPVKPVEIGDVWGNLCYRRVV